MPAKARMMPSRSRHIAGGGVGRGRARGLSARASVADEVRDRALAQRPNRRLVHELPEHRTRRVHELVDHLRPRAPDLAVRQQVADHLGDVFRHLIVDRRRREHTLDVRDDVRAHRVWGFRDPPGAHSRTAPGLVYRRTPAAKLDPTRVC